MSSGATLRQQRHVKVKRSIIIISYPSTTTDIALLTHNTLLITSHGAYTIIILPHTTDMDI